MCWMHAIEIHDERYHAAPAREITVEFIEMIRRIIDRVMVKVETGRVIRTAKLRQEIRVTLLNDTIIDLDRPERPLTGYMRTLRRLPVGDTIVMVALSENVMGTVMVVKNGPKETDGAV